MLESQRDHESTGSSGWPDAPPKDQRQCLWGQCCQAPCAKTDDYPASDARKTTSRALCCFFQNPSEILPTI